MYARKVEDERELTHICIVIEVLVEKIKKTFMLYPRCRTCTRFDAGSSKLRPRV